MEIEHEAERCVTSEEEPPTLVPRAGKAVKLMVRLVFDQPDVSTNKPINIVHKAVSVLHSGYQDIQYSHSF